MRDLKKTFSTLAVAAYLCHEEPRALEMVPEVGIVQEE